MSISLIEIERYPWYKIIGTSISQAKQNNYARFRDLLNILHSVSTPEQVAYNLTFLSRSSSVKVFLSVHCMENTLHIQTVEDLSEHIVRQLQQSHFACRKHTNPQLINRINQVRDILCGDTVVLSKSEKVVTSNTSYSGYYYYTDTLENSESFEKELDSYNDLFSLLLNSKNSLVTFQIIPTQFSQPEVYALSSLAAELKNTMQGISFHGQLYRENSAEEPQKTYAYYAERHTQALYFCNIIAASSSGKADSLAAAIKTSIQSSVSNSVSMDIQHLKLDEPTARDYFALPWNIANNMLFNFRNQNIWNGSPFQPTNLMRLPFLYTADEASVFFRLPIDDGEIHGIQSNRVTNTNETIDERVTDAANIQFGTLMNSSDTSIGASLSDFTRHSLIVGTPGSGKTTFAINLLLQFYRKGIPFLAIEPTKTEYRAMFDQVKDLQIFTPGNSGVSPLSINPFAPPRGITVEQYIPALMDAFKAAFDMESPLDVIFSSAVRKCYAKYGWKNTSKTGDADVQPFGLYEFILTFKELVASSAYSKDVRSNIETGGTFRLMNLIQQNSTLYDTVNAVHIHDFLSRPTVLELNAISGDEQKALLIALLLIQISLYIKSKGASSGQLTNVILLDEAHVLLGGNVDGQSGSKAKNSAVQLFQKMIAEIRSFGTSVIIADQAPSQVTRSIVANTDIKIAFRLVERDECEIIANSTGMSNDYKEYLARLQTGEAIAYYSRLVSPKIISTPNFREKEEIRLNVSNSEVKEHVIASHSEKPFYECKWCRQCKNGCAIKVRNQADYYGGHIIILLGDRIIDKETLTKYMYKLHDLIIQYEKEDWHNLPLKVLCNCSKIHFLRKMLLEGKFSLDRRVIDKLLRDTPILGGE